MAVISETESIADTVYSYKTDEHPELDLLITADPKYSKFDKHPFEPPEPEAKPSKKKVTKHPSESGPGSTPSVVGKASKEKRKPGGKASAVKAKVEKLDSEEEETEHIDPTCLVAAGSAKAQSGVSQYKDFIRYLPIHLSKYILGSLDQASLNNCTRVSKKWKNVAEQAHKEYFINKSLQEEVMLMQVIANFALSIYTYST